MGINSIAVGKDVPSDINVVIEIPMLSYPVKYEVDKDSGAVFVDRFMSTSMTYPCNYGFVPQTLSEDGDPIDVLVVTRVPILSGSVIRSRPIGVLIMEDESGLDEKILAVPVSKIEPFYKKIESYVDFPEIFIAQIKHFFEHYKDLDEGKWVKVKGWENVDRAKKIIESSVVRAKKNNS